MEKSLKDNHNRHNPRLNRRKAIHRHHHPPHGSEACLDGRTEGDVPVIRPSLTPRSCQRVIDRRRQPSRQTDTPDRRQASRLFTPSGKPIQADFVAFRPPRPHPNTRKPHFSVKTYHRNAPLAAKTPKTRPNRRQKAPTTLPCGLDVRR